MDAFDYIVILMIVTCCNNNVSLNNSELEKIKTIVKEYKCETKGNFNDQ